MSRAKSFSDPLTKSSATKWNIITYDEKSLLNDEQKDIRSALKYLESLPEGCKTFVVIDGISKEFSNFASELAKLFSCCILLSPLIDIPHVNKVGVHRGKDVPKAWDQKSFRIIKLGHKNSIFYLPSLSKRFLLILASFSRLRIRKKKKSIRCINVLVSLGKFPDIIQINQVLSNLKQKCVENREIQINVSLCGISDSLLVQSCKLDSNFKVRYFDIQKAHKLSNFKWDFIISGAGQTLLEFISVGVFSFVIPSHEFQHHLSKEIGGPFVRLVDTNNLENETFFRTWSESLQFINWYDYVKLFFKFRRNRSRQIWKDILKMSDIQHNI